MRHGSLLDAIAGSAGIQYEAAGVELDAVAHEGTRAGIDLRRREHDSKCRPEREAEAVCRGGGLHGRIHGDGNGATDINICYHIRRVTVMPRAEVGFHDRRVGGVGRVEASGEEAGTAQTLHSGLRMDERRLCENSEAAGLDIHAFSHISTHFAGKLGRREQRVQTDAARKADRQNRRCGRHLRGRLDVECAATQLQFRQSGTARSGTGTSTHMGVHRSGDEGFGFRAANGRKTSHANGNGTGVGVILAVGAHVGAGSGEVHSLTDISPRGACNVGVRPHDTHRKAQRSAATVSSRIGVHVRRSINVEHIAQVDVGCRISAGRNSRRGSHVGVHRAGDAGFRQDRRSRSGDAESERERLRDRLILHDISTHQTCAHRQAAGIQIHTFAHKRLSGATNICRRFEDVHHKPERCPGTVGHGPGFHVRIRFNKDRPRTNVDVGPACAGSHARGCADIGLHGTTGVSL